MLITESGTIDQLLADARVAGHQATARLIRDWTQQGLLDYPQKRPAGKGHGSAPALYPASQRNLLLTLLHHRPGQSISSLARIPVGIWMYWGEEYVSLRQARRALLRYLGDPQAKRYTHDAARATKERARVTAHAILGQLDNPMATAQARRHLLNVVADAAYTGRPDFEQLEGAIRAVFDAGYTRLRRAIGHPAAPVTTDAFIYGTRARLKAVTELTAGRVTDETFIQARDAHLFAYAGYIARQPLLAGATPPGIPQLYAPITAEDTLNNSCSHLLSAVGLELSYPERAEHMRRARAGLHLPTPAACGLTVSATTTA